MPGRASLAVIAAAALAGTCAAAAHAAPPPNDDPRAPGAFAPFTAAAGKPTETVAAGELAEATPDRGIPPCLGPTSFKRTVWYRIPEVAAPQAISVEASGATLNVVDLAAFVQPAVAVAPAPTPPPTQPTPAPSPESRSAPVATASAASNLFRPNVCDGVGAGGSDATQEPTSAISLLVPPNTPVLIQVGRRNRVSSAAADAVYLNLTDVTQTNLGQPRGDVAEPNTRRLIDGDNEVPLTGATITAEDPAVPVCPSLGTVWRRYVPDADGTRLISADSEDATTLAVFAGARPTADNVLDCVNRSTKGPLRMLVPVKRNKPLWVRVGADMTFGDEVANVNVQDGTGLTVIDGGEGGADPTFGGPGGGFPSYCNDAEAEDASVTGPLFSGTATAFSSLTRIPLTLRIADRPLCDVTLSLVKGRRTYATSRAISLAEGRHKITLGRTGAFTKGRYRLKITALSSNFDPVKVKTAVSGRLTKK